MGPPAERSTLAGGADLTSLPIGARRWRFPKTAGDITSRRAIRLRNTWKKAEAEDGAVEVELAERVRALRAGALPIESPPSLYRLNGIGTTLLGHYFDRDIAPVFTPFTFSPSCGSP
jgi:hypothetical protein